MVSGPGAFFRLSWLIALLILCVDVILSRVSWFISFSSSLVSFLLEGTLCGPRRPSANLVRVSSVVFVDVPSFFFRVPRSGVWSFVRILFALEASDIFSIFSQYSLNLSFLALPR